MAKQARSDATIKRVLDTALASVVKNGIHNVSVEQLAARSRVSMGSIYHHFGSRDGVLFALYRRCLEHMLAAIVAEVIPCRRADEGVGMMVRSYLRWVKSHPGEARVIFGIAEADLAPSHRAELAAVGSSAVQPLADWLAPHIASGRVRRMPPGLLEVALIGMAAEASRRLLAGAGGYTFADAMETLPELVWRAVANPAPRRERLPSIRRT